MSETEPTDRVHANGVDVERVRAVADRLRADPDSGREPFDARVRWIEGYRTETLLGHHGPLAGDEPEGLAGTDTGPAPEELLLGAVGQCIAVGWAGAAAANDIELRELSVEVRGAPNLAAAYGVADGSPGFDRVEVVVHIDADAPRERLEQLGEEVLARAPIPNTVSRPVAVDARLA